MHLPYELTEVFCLVFAATILFHLSENIGTEHAIKQLRYMIYAYFGMLASDIVWALSEDGLVHLNHLLFASINAVTIACVALGCYFWFRFVAARLHPSQPFTRRFSILVTIPVLVILVLDVTSIFTGWMFVIDAEGRYQSTSHFVIQTVVNYLYLLVPTIDSIRQAVKTRSRFQRSEYITYAMYMLAPLVAGLLEDVVPTVPILALNIFLVILILFLTIQNMQIYNDALTDLNNRRRLDQYLGNRLEAASREHPIALFMIDINRFKSINDVYGHVVGDQALKTMARSLKLVANRYNAFIARYGGDEFCLVAEVSAYKPEEIEAGIGESLKSTQAMSTGTDQDIEFTVSIGHAVCERPTDDVDGFISVADAKLYENKKEWYQLNN